MATSKEHIDATSNFTHWKIKGDREKCLSELEARSKMSSLAGTSNRSSGYCYDNTNNNSIINYVDFNTYESLSILKVQNLYRITTVLILIFICIVWYTTFFINKL